MSLYRFRYQPITVERPLLITTLRVKVVYTYGITFAEARICRIGILMSQSYALHCNLLLLYTTCSLSSSL